MSPAQDEKGRGDRWARLLRGRGLWVEKLSPPPTGLPDWLVVGGLGIRLVEAKTLEAVMVAPECVPLHACSGAQQFWLRMVTEHGGLATIVVLGEDGFTELPYKASGMPLPPKVFEELKVPYDA